VPHSLKPTHPNERGRGSEDTDTNYGESNGEISTHLPACALAKTLANENIPIWEYRTLTRFKKYDFPDLGGRQTEIILRSLVTFFQLAHLCYMLARGGRESDRLTT
jgi:hypothetical protein